MSDAIATLRRMLRDCHSSVVVGPSAEWHRPSFFVAKYPQQHGYRIVPVNPRHTEVQGERCHPSLADISHLGDLVEVFRRTEDMLPIAEQGHSCRRALPVEGDRCEQLCGGRTGARGRAGHNARPRLSARDHGDPRRPDSRRRHRRARVVELPDHPLRVRPRRAHRQPAQLADPHNVYSRLSNLTVAAPEERVAALEGWRAALACTSGMAAEEIALMTVLKAGDGG